MPSRSAGMSAADSLAQPRRSRAPLAVLLAVDAALAITGGALLRAGLAHPSEAEAASGERRAPASGGASRDEQPIPVAAAPSAAPSAAADAAAPPAGGGAADEARRADAPQPTAVAPPPSGAPIGAPAAEPAGGAGFAAGEPTPGQADDAPVGEGRAALEQVLAAKQGDKNAKPAKPKTEKRQTKASDAPVDPYVPAAGDLNDQIAKVFAKGQAKLDTCYSSVARGVGPTELTVTFQVTADGYFGGARILGNLAGAEVLGSCVLAELAKWKIKSGAAGDHVRRIKFRNKARE